METVVNFLHVWAIPGLLVCILILIVFGIRQYQVKKSVNTSSSKKDVLPDDEPDEAKELLQAYLLLGEKEKLTKEEEVAYGQLSELLARNYICAGHPEI